MLMQLVLIFLPLSSACFPPWVTPPPTGECPRCYLEPKPRCNSGRNATCTLLGSKTTPVNFTCSEGFSLKDFDCSMSTLVTMHGWLSDPPMSLTGPFGEALVNTTNINVIQVNYSSYFLIDGSRPLEHKFGDQSLNYLQAMADSWCCVCQEIVQLLNIIKGNCKDLSKIYLLGLSMGAQTAGCVGKHFKGIDYIFVCDAAGPVYDLSKPECRVTKGDANCVVFLKTNAGFLGTVHTDGDQNIRFNGGSKQPGCPDTSDLAVNTPLNISSLLVCNHIRCMQYVYSIITSGCQYCGKRALQSTNLPGSCEEACLEIPPMGNSCCKGIYDVNTTGTPPYCHKNTITGPSTMPTSPAVN